MRTGNWGRGGFIRRGFPDLISPSDKSRGWAQCFYLLGPKPRLGVYNAALRRELCVRVNAGVPPLKDLVRATVSLHGGGGATCLDARSLASRCGSVARARRSVSCKCRAAQSPHGKSSTAWTPIGVLQPSEVLHFGDSYGVCPAGQQGRGGAGTPGSLPGTAGSNLGGVGSGRPPTLGNEVAPRASTRPSLRSARSSLPSRPTASSPNWRPSCSPPTTSRTWGTRSPAPDAAPRAAGAPTRRRQHRASSDLSVPSA